MMTDSLQVILLVIIFIAGPFWLIYKMDKRAAKKGALFTGPATREMRLLAIVLGVVFAGLFINDLISSPTIHLLFPLLALALVGYGLGADQLLLKLQGREQNAPLSAESAVRNEPVIDLWEQKEKRTFFDNRLVRFGAKITIVLVISLILLLIAVWVSNHPDTPFSWLCIIGIAVFAVLTAILNWIGFFRTLFK